MAENQQTKTMLDRARKKMKLRATFCKSGAGFGGRSLKNYFLFPRVNYITQPDESL